MVPLILMTFGTLALTSHVSRHDNSTTSFSRPIAWQIGLAPVLNGLVSYVDTTPILINQSLPVLTLDYGLEAQGWPVLELASSDGPVSIELKFSESFGGLNSANGDGPFPFGNALSNTYRTERFNITDGHRFRSSLRQGGFRWQSVTLLSGGPITIANVGLDLPTPVGELGHLPGTFRTSKQIYTDLWSLGARTVQAACYDAETQLSTWEITNDGAFIVGQKPAQSAQGFDAANYTLTFQTMPVYGGTGWQVAAGGGGVGPYFVLATDDFAQPPISSTLFPANSLIFGYGYDLINQTSLTSGPVQVFPLSTRYESGKWYNISTAITNQGYVVSIDGIEVAVVSYDEAYTWSGNFLAPLDPRSGSWGFGPFLDQAAYFNNVQIIASNGTPIYHSDLTSQDVLDEYGVNTNQFAVCLDGAKRDRLVWLGDFVHTGRTLTKSTNRIDYIKGTLDFAFQLQVDSLVPVSSPMGVSSTYKQAYFPYNYVLTDYQMFTLLTIGNYYRDTADLDFVRPLWPQVAELTEAMLAKVTSDNYLVAGSPTDFYFISGGQQNSTAVTGLLALALQRLAPLAIALNDTRSATRYIAMSTNLTNAINRYLWSDALGTYSISLLDQGNFSVSATAFALLSGAANTTQASLAIVKLSELFLQIGYKDSSAVQASNTTQLSPFLQGFLLESLFSAHRYLNVSADVVVPVLTNLLDVFWPHMLKDGLGKDEYYTGTTWEYLYPDGSPGIGLFTSHSHPWSSAPTYVLSEYVLGIRPVEAGFKRWEFDPVLVKELGLTWAKGTVPTPDGVIEVDCRISANGSLINNIRGP